MSSTYVVGFNGWGFQASRKYNHINQSKHQYWNRHTAWHRKYTSNYWMTNIYLYIGPRFPDMYPLHIGVLETLYYNSSNSAMFLARENKKSKTYLQLMSFIQMTKTTNIYILHENKGCMELHNTLLHNIIILIFF